MSSKQNAIVVLFIVSVLGMYFTFVKQVLRTNV
jgi:hypothetical protein